MTVEVENDRKNIEKSLEIILEKFDNNFKSNVNNIKGNMPKIQYNVLEVQ